MDIRAERRIMDGEIQETQNEEQTSADEQSQSVDESGQTDGQSQDQDQSSDDKEVKKERDFEKGMYKFRDLYKEEKAKRLELEQTQVPQEDNSQTDALKLLRETVEKAVEPLKSELTQIKEEKVWDAFEKKPYVDTLSPEINAELKVIETKFSVLSLEDKLELARTQAIAKNLDTIVKVSKEAGMNQAYGNQQIKGQKGLGDSAAKPKGDSIEALWERMNSGELTDSEYLENKEQLDAYERKTMGL